MAKKKIGADDMAKHFRSKMKVGWEDTFIAENIFTAAVAQLISDIGGTLTNEVIEKTARRSCNAVRVWKRVAKEEGFHHDIVTGDDITTEG